MVESNLKRLFNLELVKSEFDIGNMRIDTLAFDKQEKSFVIIEYKKDRSFSVVDQGYAYLSLLLNNKADFVLEYNERLNEQLKRVDVDWSQSRIIFVSPEFTNYQLQAIGFKDLPIELWEAKLFEKHLVSLNKIESPETVESIRTVAPKSEIARKVNREIKVYGEEDHLNGKPEGIRDVYTGLKEKILAFGGDIRVKARKYFIFFAANTNFAYMKIQKSKVKVYINIGVGELNDPKKMARDISSVGHWGSSNYQVMVGPNDDLDYVAGLVHQAYSLHKAPNG